MIFFKMKPSFIMFLFVLIFCLFGCEDKEYKVYEINKVFVSFSNSMVVHQEKKELMGGVIFSKLNSVGSDGESYVVTVTEYPEVTGISVGDGIAIDVEKLNFECPIGVETLKNHGFVSGLRSAYLICEKEKLNYYFHHVALNNKYIVLAFSSVSNDVDFFEGWVSNIEIQ